MERPIYGWESRAHDVLSASITRHGETYPLVDAVTIHDPAQHEFAGTPHDSILGIGRFIRPDVWIIYHESTDIIEGLQAQASPEEIGAIHPVIIQNSKDIYNDRLLGGPFSTTALARRIGGKTTTRLLSEAS